MLAFLAAEPNLARLCMVEALVAGPVVVERYDAAIQSLVPYFEAGREGRSEEGPRPPLPTTEEALVGGMVSLISRRIIAGQTAELESLLPDLVEIHARRPTSAAPRRPASPARAEPVRPRSSGRGAPARAARSPSAPAEAVAGRRHRAQLGDGALAPPAGGIGGARRRFAPRLPVRLRRPGPGRRAPGLLRPGRRALGPLQRPRPRRRARWSRPRGAPAGPAPAAAARRGRARGGGRRRGGGTIRLTVPRSSSSSMKTIPLAVSGRWRATTIPATSTVAPSSIRARSVLRRERRVEARPQQLQRVRAEGEPGRAVVGDQLPPVAQRLQLAAAPAARPAAPAGCRRAPAAARRRRRRPARAPRGARSRRRPGSPSSAPAQASRSRLASPAPEREASSATPR